MDKNNNIKKVFLTGGTAGIGRATALLLEEKGFKLCIVGRDKEKMKDVMNDAKERGISELIIPLIHDVSKRKETEDFLTKIWLEQGPFDILINNAGIGFSGVMGRDIQEIGYLMDTNLISYMYLAGFFAQRMKDDGVHGDIINVGSMSSDTRDEESSGYVASKAGIQGFTEAFRKEANKHNIRVTLIEPGSVSTDMQPQKTAEKEKLQMKNEMLDAKDIANLIAYILEQDRRVSFAEVKIKPLMQFI